MQQVQQSLQLLKARMQQEPPSPTSSLPVPSPYFPPSYRQQLRAPSAKYKELINSRRGLHLRFQEDRPSMPTYQNPQYRRKFRVRIDDYQNDRNNELNAAREGKLVLPPI